MGRKLLMEKKGYSWRPCVEESLSLLWDSLCLVNRTHKAPIWNLQSLRYFQWKGCLTLVLQEFQLRTLAMSARGPIISFRKEVAYWLIFNVDSYHLTPNLEITYRLFSPHHLKMSLCSTLNFWESTETAPDNKETVRELLFLCLILGNSITTAMGYHQDFYFTLKKWVPKIYINQVSWVQTEERIVSKI